MNIILSFVLLLVFASNAYAQDMSSTSAGTNTSKTQVTERPVTKQDIQNDKALLQNRIKTYREKVSQLKDERKKMVVEKINTNVAAMNTRFTSKMTDALTRISEALTNIKNKSA